MTIKLRTTGWDLKGEHLPWIWGQINYWDIERIHWRDVLKTYRNMGHQVLSTAVLPRVHQLGLRHYDFGKQKPQLDLAAFLAEVKEAGLKIVLWVGPRDLPGVAAAGYPDELLLEAEALARDSRGRYVLSSRCAGGDVFCLPTLVSEKLTHSLRPFAATLQTLLPTWIHPDGPVIGIGLTQAPGWANALAPFDADYSQEGVAFYHAFLKKRYSKIQHLNKNYGTQFTSFQAIHPPQMLEASEVYPDSRLMDWAKCREEYFVSAAEQLHAVFGCLAMDRIPIYLATLPQTHRPANLAELEKSRCFTYAAPDCSIFHQPQAGADLTCQTRYLVSFQARIQPGHLTPDEQMNLQLKNIANGVRGWDALSPAGAGMYPGFISDRSGTPIRPRAGLWELLQQHGSAENFLTSQFYGDVYLVSLMDWERANYLFQPSQPRWDLVPHMATPALEPLPSHPALREYFNRLHQLELFLTHHQFPYQKIPSDIVAERLQKAKLLLFPSVENMAIENQEVILAALHKSIDVMLVGPMPRHPEQAEYTPLQELVGAKPKKTTSGKSEAKSKAARLGRLLHWPDFTEAKLLRAMLQLDLPRPLVIDDSRIRLTFHRLRNRIFIAAVNQSPEDIETLVRREGKFVLKDFWNENKFLGGNNEIKVKLLGSQVKFWELIPC